MRVNAVCGFLGSGKTTLLTRVLTERAGRERLAVIVNEFGEVGIDGAILAGRNVDMIELTAGCLCCTLKGSLVSALEELRDVKGVERVVIEATGVAQPSEMVDVLADPALRGLTVESLITVVDAAKFAILRKVLGPFYTAQVERADVILLNKIDLATPEQLEATRRDIAALNPRATLVPTERCDVEMAMILGKQGTSSPALSALEQGLASPAPAASFVSFVLPAAFEADRVRVERFFAALPSHMVRAKGFMQMDGQPRTVQFTAGQLEITPAAHPRSYRMVFISSGEPDRAAVETAFKETRRA